MLEQSPGRFHQALLIQVIVNMQGRNYRTLIGGGGGVCTCIHVLPDGLPDGKDVLSTSLMQVV